MHAEVVSKKSAKPILSSLLKTLFMLLFIAFITISFISRERTPLTLLKLTFDPANLTDYQWSAPSIIFFNFGQLIEATLIIKYTTKTSCKALLLHLSSSENCYINRANNYEPNNSIQTDLALLLHLTKPKRLCQNQSQFLIAIHTSTLMNLHRLGIHLVDAAHNLNVNFYKSSAVSEIFIFVKAKVIDWATWDRILLWSDLLPREIRLEPQKISWSYLDKIKWIWEVRFLRLQWSTPIFYILNNPYKSTECQLLTSNCSTANLSVYDLRPQEQVHNYFKDHRHRNLPTNKWWES